MNKKANVLFLTYDGMTEPLGQSQVLAYLKVLTEKGYSFDLISHEKPGDFEAKKHHVEEIIKGYDIRWHPMRYTKWPPVVSTVWDLIKGWFEIMRIARKHKIDIVHSRGYIIGNMSRATKCVYGAKMVFDMRGWWADEKIESGLWNHPLYRPVYRYFKNLETKMFKESDHSISLTFVGSDEIERLALKEKEKVSVIPTCVDFEIFKPFDETVRQQTRTELNIPASSKVLLYSGSLGGNYNTSLLLELFKALKNENADSYLLVISKSSHSHIEQELAKHGIDKADVRTVESDHKHMYRYLMAGDYGVVNYSRTYSTIGRSPTKLGEYWACGLPVASLSKVGDLDLLINRYPEGGILIEDPEQKYYQKAARELLAMPISRAKLREYAIDYYDLLKGVETYAAIYDSLVKG